jgi:hypothetical protein
MKLIEEIRANGYPDSERDLYLELKDIIAVCDKRRCNHKIFEVDLITFLAMGDMDLKTFVTQFQKGSLRKWCRFSGICIKENNYAKILRFLPNRNVYVQRTTSPGVHTYHFLDSSAYYSNLNTIDRIAAWVTNKVRPPKNKEKENKLMEIKPIDVDAKEEDKSKVDLISTMVHKWDQEIAAAKTAFPAKFRVSTYNYFDLRNQYDIVVNEGLSKTYVVKKMKKIVSLVRRTIIGETPFEKLKREVATVSHMARSCADLEMVKKAQEIRSQCLGVFTQQTTKEYLAV